MDLKAWIARAWTEVASLPAFLLEESIPEAIACRDLRALIIEFAVEPCMLRFETYILTISYIIYHRFVPDERHIQTLREHLLQELLSFNTVTSSFAKERCIILEFGKIIALSSSPYNCNRYHCYHVRYRCRCDWPLPTCLLDQYANAMLNS